MDIKALNRALEENNIPDDASLFYNTGWGDGTFDIREAFYSRQYNQIVLTCGQHVGECMSYSFEKDHRWELIYQADSTQEYYGCAIDRADYLSEPDMQVYPSG